MMDELGAALGKLEEPAKADSKEVALGAEPEDDFSAWMAETEDVAAAAGDSVPADVEADAPSGQAEQEEEEGEEAVAPEAAAEVLGDAGDPDADDAAALLLAMAPREAEAERQVARSFLLRSRGGGRAPEPAAAEGATAEDAAEVEEVSADEAVAADAEAAILVGEADEPRIGGAVETPDEVKAALEEELRLLEQENSGDEPELVEEAEAEPEVPDAEMGLEPEEAVPAPATPEGAGMGPAKGAEWDAEEEAGEYDPDALLAAANAEVWDVDELEAQAEAFGAVEATREKVKDSSVAELEVAKGNKSPVAAQLDLLEINSDEDAAPEEEPRSVTKLQPKPKCQLKRSAPSVGAGPPAPKTKAARQQGPADGRPLDLKHVVVNFVGVGRAYARSQLKKQGEEDSDAFDWEGVRSCVQYLASEHDLQVLGVLPEGFQGEDSWSDGTCGLPEDIRAFCESMEETPSSSSSCSVHTVVRAHRQNCRFVDGEALADYGESGLRDPECQAWLERCQDVLQIPYAYDLEIGAFNVAEGSLSKAGSDASEAPAGAGS